LNDNYKLRMKNENRFSFDLPIKRAFVCVFILFCINSLLHAKLNINEVFATNASADLDLTSYNYINWIEIYNPDAESVTLTTYYLSNDASNLYLWKLPTNAKINAKGFYTVFADELNTSNHTNFKLDPEGDTLYLSTSTGIISQFVYKEQYVNFSYGSFPDGTANYFYFSKPTRNLANDKNVFKDLSSDIIFKTVGGFFNAPVSVQLLSSNSLGKIFYTTNGSEPCDTSLLYSSNLQFTTTTVLRARVIEVGKVPGSIVTHTYFINERKIPYPIVSIVTPVTNFYDNMMGIYIAGLNGSTGYCSTSPVNWNRDWERSVNFELFDTSKTLRINQLSGVKVSGKCSRTRVQKPLTLHARKKYGKGSYNYRFFEAKNIEKYDDIYLRNSGNDWNVTLFRDAMQQTLTIGRMDLDYQADKPAVLYVNGKYFGIQNLHEKGNESYITGNFNINEDNFDFLEDNAAILIGSNVSYKNMIDYIKTHNLKNNSYFEEVEKQMDVDNYMNYLIFNYYITNADWPGNNIKFWRQKNPQTKWRWLVYDTDFGFGLQKTYAFNMLTFGFDSTKTAWPNPDWATFLARKLIDNPEFKSKFINRFYAHINTTFNPSRVNKIIDSMQNVIAPEIPFHFARYNANAANWNNNVNVMRVFAVKRPAFMRLHLREFFNLGDDVAIEYHSNIPNAGTIVMDGVSAVDSVLKGMVPSGMLSNIKFKANPGYVFVKAIKTGDSFKLLKLISSGSDWKYLVTPIAPDKAWTKNVYNDSIWKIGKSELGYGDGREVTTVGYGSNSTKKYITTYFRKYFNFDSTLKVDDAVLRLIYDDGIVVYLNGRELKRVNMPADSIIYSTLAKTAPAIEDSFINFSIDKKLLKNGQNIIAAEVHQNTESSSDMSFDLELQLTMNIPSQNKTILTSEINDSILSNTNYVAYYTKVQPIKNVVINEVLTNNISFNDEFNEKNAWIELFNKNTDSIDLAGLYISNDSNVYTKWCIPNYGIETKMAPNSYFLLWADATPNQGFRHLGFAIENVKTKLFLSQIIGKDTLLIDKFEYDKITGARSNGRIPNGTGAVKTLKVPTLVSANIDNETSLNSTVRNENYINFNRQNSVIDITSNNLMNRNVSVFVSDVSGRVVYRYYGIYSMGMQVSLSKQKPGLYLVRLVDNNNIVSKKIVK
jgi:hypothetical protein